jgi:hypothetical protein
MPYPKRREMVNQEMDKQASQIDITLPYVKG